MFLNYSKQSSISQHLNKQVLQLLFSAVERFVAIQEMLHSEQQKPVLDSYTRDVLDVQSRQAILSLREYLQFRTGATEVTLNNSVQQLPQPYSQRLFKSALSGGFKFIKTSRRKWIWPTAALKNHLLQGCSMLTFRLLLYENTLKSSTF